MPYPELSYRRQKAVLLAATDPNDYPEANDYGETKVDTTDPVEIKVRWVQTKREAIDPQGNVIAIDATVIVDREVVVGSKLWLGPLADYYGTGGDDVEFVEVVSVARTPDLKNRAIRRELGVRRFRGTLPSNT